MYIEEFTIYLTIDKSYSKNTISSYLININGFFRYCNTKNIDILNVEYIDILNYLSFLKDNKKYMPKSINTIISCLKSYYAFLLEEKYIINNPTSLLKSPKMDKKFPIYLSFDEIKKIFYSIDTSNDLGKRNYLIFLLLYDTGVRVSELLDIKLNNIDYESKSIKIVGKGSKERIVYFTKDTLDLLLYYIKNIYDKFEIKSNFLFSNKKGIVLSRNEVYNIIVKCSRDAGIAKHVTPHIIRHSFATHMIQNDADIMSVKTILGHSNVSTTQIYTHLNKKDLKRKYDELKERK